MSTIADHDSYIASAPEPFRPLLDHLRTLLRGTLPDAVEMVAYSMPGFAIDGEVVASYAAFSKQVGVYFPAAAVAEHAETISAAGFKHTKTGVTFTPRKPLPDDLVVQLARTSRQHAVDRG